MNDINPQEKPSISDEQSRLLKVRNAELEEQIRDMQLRLRRFESEQAATAAQIEAANQRAKESQEKLKSTRENFAEAKEKLRASISTTRDRLKSTSELWGHASRYYSLFWQGLLADEISKSEVNLGAETYLCLLPSTVPAALELQRKHGGRIICDCVENVEVERQSLAPKLHPPTLDMINLAAYGALSRVDGLMTVSNAVAETLGRFGPPVRVQPNYRRYEEVPNSTGRLREKFGLPSDARVLVATGGIVGGFEAIIDAMALLPRDIHLVTFAKFSPAEYSDRVNEHIDSKGLSSRIHLNGFVDYEELAPLLADADAGLIVLDPQNPNHSVSLPNRVFDFTAAALPFVSPNVREIAAHVARFQCGITISEVNANEWASGILSVLADLETYKSSMFAARGETTWESLDDGLIEFLGNPGSVTLLGFRDLSRYQRFLRVTDSLTSRGIKVKAAFFSKDPMPIDNIDADYYFFSDRYGRGPGLIPVARRRSRIS